MAVDLLVFGPHPDDLEIGLGGTIAKHAADGLSVGLCDLTAGELSTNGTPEVRAREAAEATRILGAQWRECLGWPDGGLTRDQELVRSAAEFIRQHQPRTIAVPYWNDRHPDHRGASEILQAASFMSGLRRYTTSLPPWKPDWVCFYFINDSIVPTFVIDVSPHYETKRAALACYHSQFVPTGADAEPTRLTSPRFQQLIESRDAYFGSRAGVAFAEGIVVRESHLRTSLMRDGA